MLSINEQIYGASLIWSEAKYNFPFWNIRRDIDWDKEYQEILTKVSKPMDIIDYYLELMKFISLLNDGHTFITFPKEIKKEIKTLPIKIKHLNKKHIVINVAKDCQVPLFSEIYKINNIDFNEYMNKKVFPYCWNIKPSSSYEMLYTFSFIDDNSDKNAYSLIPILEKDKKIELLTSKGLYTINPIERNVEWSLPIDLKIKEKVIDKFTSKGLIIQYTYDNIAILTLPTFMDDMMPQNFYNQLEKLKDCKGFIIDIRNNGGGNSDYADAFSQAFIKGRFKSGKVKHPIHIGAYKAWGEEVDYSTWNLNDPWNKKVYDICNHNLFEEEITTAYFSNCPLTLEQPVVILENTATASSSENLLINFDTISRATIVGTPSYGSTGNPLSITLPGGGKANICTRRYTYPNDKEFINIGIKPHIYSELTQDDLIAGFDSVLSKGLEVLRKQI